MSELYGFGYTLEETIQTMRDVIDTGNYDRMFLDTYYWLEMLLEYREIGTVEECRTAMEYWKYLRERRCGLDAIVEKCMEYEKIGTVEECREAVEKSRSLKVYVEQVLWERNIAIQQLEEIGISLGEKMDFVKEAVEKQKAKKKIQPKTALERYYHAPECPNCKRELRPQVCGYTLAQAIGIYSYCPWCGQALMNAD